MAYIFIMTGIKVRFLTFLGVSLTAISIALEIIAIDNFYEKGM